MADAVCQVWRRNLDDAFAAIADLIEEYPYVAIATEFPGVVAQPIAHLEYHYNTVKCNVDLVNCLQVGFSFANGRGEAPAETSTFQFNFQFALSKDIHDHDTVEHMSQNGLDFQLAEDQGIDPVHFGELLVGSGLVMNADVRWITYHGCYDFAYLLKMLTCAFLPKQMDLFRERLQDYFPSSFDLKYILKTCHDSRVSGDWTLSALCEYLGIYTKEMHCRAGLTALATNRGFFMIVGQILNHKLDDSRFCGVVYGLEETDPPPRAWLAKDPPSRAARSERLPPGMLRLRPHKMASDSTSHPD